MATINTARLAVILLGLIASAARAETPATQPAFPQSWLGKWAGDCAAHSAGGRVMNIRMELTVAATAKADEFDWTITYIDGEKRQDRRYALIAVEPDKGRWKIDERNGIVLLATLLGETLVSVFDVQESRLVATYRRAGEAIEFGIVVVPEKPTKTGGDGVPEVNGFEASAVQRAVLVKQP